MKRKAVFQIGQRVSGKVGRNQGATGEVIDIVHRKGGGQKMKIRWDLNSPKGLANKQTEETIRGIQPLLNQQVQQIQQIQPIHFPEYGEDM
jgi:hypothetical protein